MGQSTYRPARRGRVIKPYWAPLGTTGDVWENPSDKTRWLLVKPRPTRSGINRAPTVFARLCEVTACGRIHDSRGLCGPHYRDYQAGRALNTTLGLIRIDAEQQGQQKGERGKVAMKTMDEGKLPRLYAHRGCGGTLRPRRKMTSGRIWEYQCDTCSTIGKIELPDSTGRDKDLSQEGTKQL